LQNTFELPATVGRVELKMHILVATKQADLRLAIELYLTEEPGLEIVGTAREAASLRALLQTSRPDLVLLDWDLPGHPPADLVTEAKSVSSCQVVVLGRDLDIKPAALTAGADDFVLKGDSPRHLLDAIQQARSRRVLFDREKSIESKGE
jgi:DNA-binding NarL/FixJ family response regulator